MGPTHDDREPQEEPTREPLVDLNVNPPQPGEPGAGPMLRRKRLSDMEPEGDEAPPQPQTSRQRRRSLAASAAGSEEPPSEAESSPEPRRPRLVDIAAAPEEQEPRLKVGRARVTITQPSEDLPGLQNIVDPPRALSAVLDLGQSEIKPLVPDRQPKQSLSMALVGGLAAAVVGAMVWAVITVATNYQIGWMAVGVGFLVGGAVRTLGRGSDKSFGYLGATMSVFGCLLGNLLSICAIVAGQEGLSPLAVVAHVGSHPAVIPAALLATFRPLDLLFYAIAIYEGYRFSFRQVTNAELSRVTARN